MKKRKPKRTPAPASAPLTAQSLGFVDNVKLSTRYNNTRKHFKIVLEEVLGYHVSRGGPPRIAPIHRAEIWIQDASDPKTKRIFTSHEVGDYYNPPRAADEEPDDDAAALARVAVTAIDALEHHARLMAAKRPAKPRRA